MGAGNGGITWGSLAFVQAVVWSARQVRCVPCPHPAFSLSTALRPEEAESALEATCYFTEESPSGEPCSLVALRPCCGAHTGGLQPWVHRELTAALGSLKPGQGQLRPSRRVPRVFSLLFLLSLPSWTLASPSLCPLLYLHFPFQHLLWPQIWTFSCPGRLKVSLWGGQEHPFALGLLRVYGSVFLTCLHGHEAWRFLVQGCLLCD